MMYAVIGQILKYIFFHYNISTPTRLDRNKHPDCFRQVYNRSDHYKHSFIPNTIVAWNALPNMAFEDSEIAPEYVERFTNYL